MGDVAICTEMGRFMLGPYGCLVTKAIHEKQIYKDYIGVDASAVDLIRPAMYGAYHHITVMGQPGGADKATAPVTNTYDITGNLCENNDKFAIDRKLPHIDMGDLLVIHDTGAHGYSMGYNYNGRLRSAEVLLRPDGAALVSGTTGYTPEQMDRLRELGQNTRVMHSGNYSIGIAALRHLVAQATRELPGFDCEIVETHHNQKVDAPSGTAKLLLDAVVEAEPEAGYHPVYGREGMCGARDPKEIGMHSLRGGTVAGVHEVSFFGQDEEVTLTHRATSRQIFVNGALAAAQKLVTREPGFYTFDKVMFA